MSLSQHIVHIKRFLGRDDVYMSLLIVVIGVASFGLGRLSSEDTTRTEVRIEEAFPAAVYESQNKNGVQFEETGGFVGSRQGSKYHYPWCGGATRIKEENKIWFVTREAAEQAGYTPAANCKGL